MPNYYLRQRGDALNILYQSGRNNKYPIPLNISVDSKYFYRTALSKADLEKFVPDGKWITKGYKDHVLLNIKITKWLDELKHYVNDFHAVNKYYPEAKSLAGFFNKRPVAGPKTFKEVWAEFTEVKQIEGISEKRLEHYAGTLNKILEFKPTITLAEVHNKKFYPAFTSWLEDKVNSANTVGSRIRMWKCFLNWCVEEGKIVMEAKVKSMVGKNEKRDVIYLERDEIEILANFETGDDHLNRIRDAFIVLCLTGLRHSDSNSERWSVDGGFIKIWPKKTQDETEKIATIPIRAQLRALLDKYGKNLPIISNQQINEHIKTIAADAELNREISLIWGRKGYAAGAKVKLWKLMSCHVGRSTFVTECGNSGQFTTEQIAAMLGIREKKVSTYLNIQDAPLKAAMDRMESQLKVVHVKKIS